MKTFTVSVCECGVIFADEGRVCIGGDGKCEVGHTIHDTLEITIDLSMLYCWVVRKSKAAYLRVKRAAFEERKS